MQVSKLAPLSKQLGNKIIEARDNKFFGYNITAYRGYTPIECELVNQIDNPTDKVMSWDTAYDMLFGTPTEKPDFSKVIR